MQTADNQRITFLDQYANSLVHSFQVAWRRRGEDWLAVGESVKGELSMVGSKPAVANTSKRQGRDWAQREGIPNSHVARLQYEQIWRVLHKSLLTFYTNIHEQTSGHQNTRQYRLHYFVGFHR